MIKVLHLVSTPAIWSGVMTVIMNYYRHIDRSEIQFDFLCFIPCKSSMESFEEEILSLGGNVYFISKPGSSLVSIKELETFFYQRAAAYTWLHNHEIYLSFILKSLARRFKINNFIMHGHATKYSDRKLQAIRNAILCFPNRFLKTRYNSNNEIVFRVERLACSYAVGIFLFGKKKVQQNKIHIFYNAIDVKKYLYDSNIRLNLQQELHITDRFVIGHVGRFVPQKNHRFILKLFKKILDSWKTDANLRSRPLLLLIGDGPDRSYIEQLSHDLGINSDIFFLGPRTDVSQLYNVMDIFILPSLYEGMPVACIEAQANGLKCLVSQTVTPEVAFTDHVQFLSIDKGTSPWECILENEITRNVYISTVNIPCIQEEAQKLSKLYLL